MYATFRQHQGQLLSLWGGPHTLSICAACGRFPEGLKGAAGLALPLGRQQSLGELQVSTPAQSRSARITGSFHMLGESGPGGGAGCSTTAHPPVMMSSRKACSTNIRSSLPTMTCCSSLRRIQANPQSSSALRTGLGPVRPSAKPCSLAAVHVSHGGPSNERHHKALFDRL